MNAPRMPTASRHHPAATRAGAMAPRRDPILALSLAVAAIIHLLPLPGVLGAAALQRLYGIPMSDPGLTILLQHRAVLFGLLGSMLLGAIRIAPWRGPALTAGLVSTTSFLALAWLHGGHNAALQRVLLVDAAAVALLALGAWREVAARSHRPRGG